MEEIFSEDNWDFEREKGDNQTNKFSRSLSSPNPVPSQLVKCSSPLDELFIEAEELQQLSNQEEIDNKNNNNSLLNLDEEERRKRFKSCSTSHLDIPPPKEGGILRKFRFGSKQQLDQNNSAVDSSKKKSKVNLTNSLNGINLSEEEFIDDPFDDSSLKARSPLYEALIKHMGGTNPYSNWNTKAILTEDWLPPLPHGKLGYSPLISFSILESSYLIENGNINSKMDLKEEREINNREGDFSYYSILLETGNVVEHYVGESQDEVYIITIEIIKDKKFQRVIVRNSMQDFRVFIAGSSAPKIMKELINQNLYLRDIKFIRVKNMTEEWSKELIQFEESQIVTTYKIGILNATQNQITDDDFFNNQIISDDYAEFLEFIGTKIELFDWNKFRAGLDTKGRTTGEHSVYTTHKGYEIMFHVANYLPFNNFDPQQVERKRHLGNDVIIIVFKEGEPQFDPIEIKSQFNHVFFVIQKISAKGETTKYRLELCCKPGVNTIHPAITTPNIYEKNDEFRDFLLTKLINAERAAMQAKDFRTKLFRTRKLLISSLIDKSKK